MLCDARHLGELTELNGARRQFERAPERRGALFAELLESGHRGLWRRQMACVGGVGSGGVLVGWWGVWVWVWMWEWAQGPGQQ